MNYIFLDEKYSIFGAGDYGRKALKEYGNEKINYFIDNNRNLYQKDIDGIPIISLEEYMKKRLDDVIIIAILNSLTEICIQLENNGIYNYRVYYPTKQNYFSKDILVYNQYEFAKEKETEEEWNRDIFGITHRKYIQKSVEILLKNQPFFNHIEIETYNRCNGVCEFCPVSIQNDIRAECKMTVELFKKIILELAEMNYSGRIALFSNNEPFLDERIFDFQQYARKKLPYARFHLFTNGTQLTLEKFKRIINELDELIIDNYSQNLNLTPNSKAIKEYCEIHTELIKKVTIVLRKPKEILTTRGGESPNRRTIIDFGGDTCMLPFKQMIVRPDGKVSLCCNDPYGRNTMGDLTKQTLTDVWYSKEFDQVRKKIAKGRKYWKHCTNCDTFLLV